MAPLRSIKAALKDNEIMAKFEEDTHQDYFYKSSGQHLSGSFKHALSFDASEPFLLQQVTHRSGPYAGYRGFIIVKARPFPFCRLPPELRQQIYKLVFPCDVPISIGKEFTESDPFLRALTWKGPTRKISILLVNRAITEEAREFLYHGKHFIFGSIGILNPFLSMIGTGRKYLTHLTVNRSGHLQFATCYRNLVSSTRLQRFNITLPSTLKASLTTHIDTHWKDLSVYLLANEADLEESLRRLQTIRFQIGSGMTRVLDADDDPIKEMDEERQKWCMVRIRRKLHNHFTTIVIE